VNFFSDIVHQTFHIIRWYTSKLLVLNCLIVYQFIWFVYQCSTLSIRCVENIIVAPSSRNAKISSLIIFAFTGSNPEGSSKSTVLVYVIHKLNFLSHSFRKFLNFLVPPAISNFSNQYSNCFFFCFWSFHLCHKHCSPLSYYYIAPSSGR
jgi:hypothetical protein